MAFDDAISGAMNTPAPPNAPNTNAPNTSGESELGGARPLPLNTQPEEASNVDAGNTLMPPAASPAPAQPPAQRSLQLAPQERRPAPGEYFRNLSHALQGAVLGAVAGPTHTVDYTVDDSGRTVGTPRKLRPVERLQMMAAAALTGLAAGSQVGPQKSGAASIAAGMGAGAQAQMARAQQQDLLKRQQARTDYEAEQKTLMDKAVRSMHNASTYSLWAKAMQEQNDHDPERQKNIDIMNAVNDYISRNPASDMQVQIITPEQMRAVQQQDKHSLAKHTFLPIGMKMLTDAKGQPVYDSDGNPRSVGQIAMISGTDGAIPLPSSYISDIKKFSSFVPGLKAAENLEPGFEMPLPQFLGLDKALNAAKIQEIDGWKNAVSHVQKDGSIIQENAFTHETRPAPAAGDTKETAGIKKEQADTSEANARAGLASEQTKQLREWDSTNNHVDDFGNPVGSLAIADKKSYQEAVRTYTKDYGKDITQLDKARFQLKNIIDNADKTGNLPGADSVVGIFDAIGISADPLKGRGLRIGEHVITEHVGSRNVWETMRVKMSRVAPEGTGQVVTLDQLKAYERIMDESRLDAYVAAADDAINRHIGVQFVPQGNGAKPDQNTIDIFVSLAKRDPKLAADMLRKNGWVASAPAPAPTR